MIDRPAASLHRVILYKHGMGYFEREARVSGDAIVELDFKQSEMNDVLKSLSVYDLDGGLIANVAYEGVRPLSREIEDIGIDLPAADALTGTLANLRGVSVALKIGSTEVRGDILGTETMQRHNKERVWNDKRLSVRTADGAIRSFSLLDIDEIIPLEERTNRDLARLLDVLVYWKKKETKRISIFAKDSASGDGGERRIVVSYAVEAPVWKTSYRMLLRESQSLIQGWALIDNNHDEDWSDIRLSLVAGMPVSFRHDLYTPRYRQRPEIRVEEEAAYGAPVVERGMPAAAPARVFAKTRGGAAEDLSMNEIDALMSISDVAADMGAAPHLGEALQQVASISSRETDSGNFYVYDVNLPVSVDRGQSALVPILAERFEGRRIALYDQHIRPEGPMSAVLFENTTGLTLEGGPVTIFAEDNAESRASGYVGEAMLSTLKDGERAFLPYAVEPGCRIEIDHRSREAGVFRCVIVQGSITLHYKEVARTIYNIDNSANKQNLDLYLDHGFREAWELSEGHIAPEERTASSYRFRVDVPAAGVHVFEVVEEGRHARYYKAGELSESSVLEYHAAGYFDDATAQTLHEALQLAVRIARLKTDIEERRSTIKEIETNQGRLRENLGSLGEHAEEQELRRRYVGRLRDDEDNLERLRAEIEDLSGKLREIREERTTLLQKISLDRKL